MIVYFKRQNYKLIKIIKFCHFGAIGNIMRKTLILMSDNLH